MRSHELVPCKACGQPAGKRCRTLTTNRSTDTHSVRHFDAHQRLRLRLPT